MTISYSLFTQYSDEHGLELSDIGIDWAVEIQNNIPGGVDAQTYLAQQVSDFPRPLKDLFFELWDVSNAILVQSVVTPDGA